MWKYWTREHTVLLVRLLLIFKNDSINPSSNELEIISNPCKHLKKVRKERNVNLTTWPELDRKKHITHDTFSFGRLALVVCNLWRRFKVFISSAMTSSHHSIHFASLNCSYTSSSSDISPSSLAKGSALANFWGLSLFACNLTFAEAAALFSLVWAVLWTLSLTFLEALRPPLTLEFLPPAAASSWQELWRLSIHSSPGAELPEKKREKEVQEWRF